MSKQMPFYLPTKKPKRNGNSSQWESLQEISSSSTVSTSTSIDEEQNLRRIVEKIVKQLPKSDSPDMDIDGIMSLIMPKVLNELQPYKKLNRKMKRILKILKSQMDYTTVIDQDIAVIYYDLYKIFRKLEKMERIKKKIPKQVAETQREEQVGCVIKSAKMSQETMLKQITSSNQSLESKKEQIPCLIKSSLQYLDSKDEQIPCLIKSSLQYLDSKDEQIPCFIKSSKQSLESKRERIPSQIKSSKQSLESKKEHIPSQIKSSKQSLESKKEHIPSLIKSSKRYLESTEEQVPNLIKSLKKSSQQSKKEMMKASKKSLQIISKVVNVSVTIESDTDITAQKANSTKKPIEVEQMTLPNCTKNPLTCIQEGTPDSSDPSLAAVARAERNTFMANMLVGRKSDFSFDLNCENIYY